MAELARSLGLPRSSYSSLECGAYQIKLDLLHQVLTILDADINDVWPTLEDEGILASRSQLLRTHQFRLDELLSICRANSGLLLSKHRNSVQVHLSSRISDSLSDRIVLYVEENQLFLPGFWFTRKQRNTSFLLYLTAEQAPQHVSFLIQHYLAVWASFFEASRASDIRTSN